MAGGGERWAPAPGGMGWWPVVRLSSGLATFPPAAYGAMVFRLAGGSTGLGRGFPLEMLSVVIP